MPRGEFEEWMEGLWPDLEAFRAEIQRRADMEANTDG